MDPNPISTLVRDILNGRKDRFVELVDPFHKPIYNLALRMTGSAADAADLTQDIFVRAWIHLDKYDPQKKFFTWLYTLALNLIRNHLKERKLPRTDAPAVPEETRAETAESNPAAALEAEQEKARLQGLLLRLPAEQREALLMRFFSGLSFEEMAGILGISKSGAKMRVSRALERLRTLVANDVGADSIRD